MIVYKRDEEHPEQLIWVAVPVNAIKRVSSTGKTLEIFNSGFSSMVEGIDNWGRGLGEEFHFNGEPVTANVRLSIKNPDYQPEESDDRSARKRKAQREQEKLDAASAPSVGRIVHLEDRPVLDRNGQVVFPVGSAVVADLLSMNLSAGVWTMGPAPATPR